MGSVCETERECLLRRYEVHLISRTLHLLKYLKSTQHQTFDEHLEHAQNDFLIVNILITSSRKGRKVY